LEKLKMINVEELNNFFVSQPEMVLLEANQEKYTIEGSEYII